ncbi:MFS transporter [Agrobacterium larrymoorei]|uniref:MFS transporter n=1 Tax=Agrobacterium larrymoorei TaxID=160699 RepID=UPI001572CEF5|nr:MFS transporter [Agrobacterium larrymoorei]NTJ43206.1 MFS transporter [Agrobacterium larrymoorei]
MQNQIRLLLPVLITAGIVIGAHGLQLTFVAVRAAHAGFPVTTIGVMSAVYSLGFGVGCLSITRLFSALSHRQTFAILALYGSAVTASMTLTVKPEAWIVLRFLSGFTYAGLLAIIESSINANITNSHRARALSVHRLVNLGSVALAQYVIPSAGVDGPTIFLLIAGALIISLLPFSLVRVSRPAGVVNMRSSVLKAWRISPVAVLGTITTGLTVTTFRSTGPVYAHSAGMAPADIATFMSAGILGGLILLYPLSLFSDRSNRILVVILTMLGAVATEACIAVFAGTSQLGNLAGIVAFGAFSFPLYALSAAHGNDRAAAQADYLTLAAALLFFTSIGGTLGPLIVSSMMERYGYASFLYYMMAVHAAMGTYALFALNNRDRTDPAP